MTNRQLRAGVVTAPEAMVGPLAAAISNGIETVHAVAVIALRVMVVVATAIEADQTKGHMPHHHHRMRHPSMPERMGMAVVLGDMNDPAADMIGGAIDEFRFR